MNAEKKKEFGKRNKKGFLFFFAGYTNKLYTQTRAYNQSMRCAGGPCRSLCVGFACHVHVRESTEISETSPCAVLERTSGKKKREKRQRKIKDEQRGREGESRCS